MTIAQKQNKNSKPLRIGIVVPHIFMQRNILPHVIFSPGTLALSLVDNLIKLGAEVTLFTPGAVDTKAINLCADLSYFEKELSIRNDTYIDLLKKHPLTFVSLARQVQSELVATAFNMANNNELDIVHIYTNEEDIALPFIKLCGKPILLTHHDPFNFLVTYKSVFPKYAHLNWLSLSYAQRSSMPSHTNWVANIYHGTDGTIFKPVPIPTESYIAYLGRIIEPKGVHMAIEAVKKYNKKHKTNLVLKIAGKHYAGAKKNTYWSEQIEPKLSETIEYVGHIHELAAKQEFLAHAKALIIPSTFEEPFGMVMIEALACGTPLIGLSSGAIPEIIQNGRNGILIKKTSEQRQITDIARAIESISEIDRRYCRNDFEARFTAQRMASEHFDVYKKLHTSTG